MSGGLELDGASCWGLHEPVAAGGELGERPLLPCVFDGVRADHSEFGYSPIRGYAAANEIGGEDGAGAALTGEAVHGDGDTGRGLAVDEGERFDDLVRGGRGQID